MYVGSACLLLFQLGDVNNTFIPTRTEIGTSEPKCGIKSKPN